MDLCDQVTTCHNCVRAPANKFFRLCGDGGRVALCRTCSSHHPDGPRMRLELGAVETLTEQEYWELEEVDEVMSS